MKITTALFALVVVALAGTHGIAAATSEPDPSVAIDTALASPDRPEADRAQDERRNARFAAKGIEARYAGNRLPNVQQLTVEVDQLELPPGSLDAVFFVMSYHDLYWRPLDRSWPPTDPAQMLRKLHAALKVGGVVIVQDHVAVPGGDTAAVVDRLHRIDPEVVRRDFKAAGFALEAESPMLARPDDDHAKQVFDPDIRGRTDRFVFRFRRPGP